MIISANDIKVKGLSFIDKILKKGKELFITLRGKKKFVIMDIKEYERLKEAELGHLSRKLCMRLNNSERIM